MKRPVESLQEKFQQLRLSETARELPDLLRKAESASWTYHELLHELLSHETGSREAKMIEKNRKLANFPYHRTLDEYRLEEQSALGERQFKQLKNLDWVGEYFTLIFMGPPGVGKTHLAVGLGIEAVNLGHRVSFVSMAELIYILKTKEYTAKSRTRHKRLQASELIIIDDIMYMAMEPQESNLFFQFIYEQYDHAAFILTSNKGPDEWGKFLGDPAYTSAILDRLLHRSEIISYGDDPSNRMKYRKTLFN